MNNKERFFRWRLDQTIQAGIAKQVSAYLRDSDVTNRPHRAKHIADSQSELATVIIDELLRVYRVTERSRD